MRGGPAQLAPIPAHPYTPTKTTRSLKQLAFTISAPELGLDEPFDHDDTQTRFHAHFGQTVQLSGQRGRLAVVAEPQSHVCLSAEENGRFGTSKYVVATNDLCKCLNYERLASSPVLDVRVCDGDDSMIANAQTMTTPPSTSKQCKYGPHSRPRDEMKAEGNVRLDARQGGENNVRPLFSPLSSTHCPMQHPPLCVPTGLGSGSLGHRNPLVARHRPVDCPSHGGVHALEAQAQGGQPKSIEQVDLHRVNCLAPPHEKLYWLV